MPDDYGKAKRNLARSRLLCRHILDHLAWIHDTYESSQGEFAERVFLAAQTTKALDEYLEGLQAMLAGL